MPIQGQVVLQHGQRGENVDDTQEAPPRYVTKHGSQRPDGKRLKGQPNPGLPQPPLIESSDEEEEVRVMKSLCTLLSFRQVLSCSIDRFLLVRLCNSVLLSNEIELERVRRLKNVRINQMELRVQQNNELV